MTCQTTRLRRWGLWLMLMAPAPAAAQDRPPILAIEAGAHLQRVENLFLDRPHREVVSVSTDGTVRSWDQENGQLLQTRTLLPGGTGLVQKSGLSRSGAMLAFGFTGVAPIEREYLVLLDRSGVRPARIVRLGDRVSAVAFGPQDTAMAVAEQGVVTLLALPDLRVIRSDRFGDIVWSLDFDEAGRLAAASFDGTVRLYGPDGARLAQARATAGTEITDAKFAPDGRHLALGFNSGQGNEVLAVPGLDHSQVLRPPSALVGPVTEFSRIGWTADGHLLATATRQTNVPGHMDGTAILDWGQADGASSPVLVHGAEGRLLNFVPLPAPEGRTAIAAGFWNGDVYRADGAGITWRTPVVKLSFDQMEARRLLVSADGAVVAFLGDMPDQGFRLDLAAERLEPGGTGAGLAQPMLSAPGLALTGAPYRTAVNGRVLKLERWEGVASWAVAADGSQVALATRWSLRCVGADGASRWTLSLPTEAWAVNQSADGRFVVAALGDGTVRWYDAATGAERLAAFVQADRSRWVAWRPDARFTGDARGGALLQPFADAGHREVGPAPMNPDAFYRAFRRPDAAAELFRPAR